jgi:hypothetical protein
MNNQVELNLGEIDALEYLEYLLKKFLAIYRGKEFQIDSNGPDKKKAKTLLKFLCLFSLE